MVGWLAALHSHCTTTRLKSIWQLHRHWRATSGPDHLLLIVPLDLLEFFFFLYLLLKQSVKSFICIVSFVCFFMLPFEWFRLALSINPISSMRAQSIGSGWMAGVCAQSSVIYCMNVTELNLTLTTWRDWIALVVVVVAMVVANHFPLHNR